MHEFMTINKNKFLTTKVFTKMVKLSLSLSFGIIMIMCNCNMHAFLRFILPLNNVSLLEMLPLLICDHIYKIPFHDFCRCSNLENLNL